ncbi:hypothetical protein D3C87_1213880 [compost metagenome]
MQHFQLDVLAKIRAVHQQFQAAPRRLQLLELGLMQDHVHLFAQGAINLGNHLVNPVFVDRLLMIAALQDLTDERSHALASYRVAFLRRAHGGVGQQLIKQRRLFVSHQHLGGGAFHRHGEYSVDKGVQVSCWACRAPGSVHWPGVDVWFHRSAGFAGVCERSGHCPSGL